MPTDPNPLPIPADVETRRELARLRGQVDELRSLLADMGPDEAQLLGIDRNGAISVKHWAVPALAASFADFLGDAPNYKSVCVDILHGPGDDRERLRLEVVVRRAEGKTPSERASEAMAEVERLTHMISDDPDAKTSLPPWWQKLWESCNGLVEKADFKACFRHMGRVEGELGKAQAGVAHLRTEIERLTAELATTDTALHAADDLNDARLVAIEKALEGSLCAPNNGGFDGLLEEIRRLVKTVETYVTHDVTPLEVEHLREENERLKKEAAEMGVALDQITSVSTKIAELGEMLTTPAPAVAPSLGGDGQGEDQR